MSVKSWQKTSSVLAIHHYCLTIGIGLCLLMVQKKVFAVDEAALPNRPIRPFLATTLTYDANLLRLPKGYTQEMSGNRTHTDDFVKEVKAGFNSQWKVSQQVLTIDGSINQDWFSTFNELDYTGYDVLAQWDWKLAKRFTGTFSYSRSFRLAGFTQINRLLDNLVSEERYLGSANYEFIPDWYLHASFLRNNIHYPDPEREFSDLIEETKEFGLRYANPLEDIVDFYVTLADGKYPNRSADSPFDNAYSRTTYSLRGVWNYSVKTRLRAEVGYTSQTFPHVPDRNFADIVANADILWQVTPKTSLYLEAWRNISAIQNVVANFSLTEGVRFTPTWNWSDTPKVQVELPLLYERQSYLGLRNVDFSAFPQTNEVFSGRINFNYEPIPNVKITAFASYEAQKSTDPIQTYQDQIVGITIQGSF